MFQLRNEHAEAFRTAARSDFLDRADRYLCANFPTRFAPLASEVRRQFIADAQQRAKRYHLRSERAVVFYAHLLLLAGQDFDVHPRAAALREHLGDERRPDSQRAWETLHLTSQAVSKVSNS